LWKDISQATRRVADRIKSRFNHSMQKMLGCILVLVAGISGCTTKAKAKADAKAAYTAGQQQAIANMQPRPPTVSVFGQVRNQTVNWTEDLTLSKAIVAADYLGATDPRAIFIIRNGQNIYIDPKLLLKGDHDTPLEPGDVVELRR